MFVLNVACPQRRPVLNVACPQRLVLNVAVLNVACPQCPIGLNLDGLSRPPMFWLLSPNLEFLWKLLFLACLCIFFSISYQPDRWVLL